MTNKVALNELTQAVARAQAEGAARVFRLTQFPGLVIKTTATEARQWSLVLASALISLVIQGRLPRWSALRLAGSPQQTLREVARLQALKELGLGVPEVICTGPSWFALEDCGQADLETELRELPHGSKQALLCEIAQDLAHWHRSGAVHGAAQVRNILRVRGELVRIDFEEDLAGLASDSWLRAYDGLLMLHSIARHQLRHDWPEDQAQLALATMFRCWRDASAEAFPSQEWDRVRQWLSRVARGLQTLRKWTKIGRDGDASLRLDAALRHAAAADDRAAARAPDA